jgi:hypothetical protein
MYISELNLRLPLSISNFKTYYDERKALKEVLNNKLFNDLKSFLLKNFSFKNFENKIPLLGVAMYSNSNESIIYLLKKVYCLYLKSKNLWIMKLYHSEKATLHFTLYAYYHLSLNILKKVEG